MDITSNEAANTPKHGKVKPVDIFSLERRKIDEDTVAELVEVLTRHGDFLHPIAVRAEGATRHRLIAGANRLEAWKRYFGEQVPIPASIYSSNTSDARIAAFQKEENLVRKELTPAERQAEMLRYAAALKKLEGEKLATELPLLGSDAKSATRGGRGKKAATAKMAAKLRLSKTAVQNWTKEASAAIGEEINLDHDTPEELERKAAELERKAEKHRRAEPEVLPLKRRKPAPCAATEDVTPPAEPQHGDVGSKIEAARKAFDALGRKDQLRFIHDICRSVGLEPLMMAPPAVFGLADEEPELVENAPAAVAPATDDAAVVQAEPGDDGADLGAEDLQVVDDDDSEDTADDVSEAADQEEELGAEDLEDAGDAVPEAADQEPASVNLHAEHLQDAGVEGSEAADQESGGALKCAYCTMPFEGGDECVMIYGRPYHADLCAKFAKPPIAIAA